MRPSLLRNTATDRVITYLGLVEAISLGPQEGRHRRRIFHVQPALRVLLRIAQEKNHSRQTNTRKKMGTKAWRRMSAARGTPRGPGACNAILLLLLLFPLHIIII